VTFAAIPTSVCVNATPITLTGSPAGGTFTGPGTSGTTFDPAAAGVGTHTLTYSFTDACGTGTATRTITVQPQIQANFSLNPALGEAPLTVTLNANVPTGTPVLWEFSNGFPDLASPSATLTFPDRDSVRIRLITNPNGTCPDTTEQTLIITDPQIVSVAPNVFTPNGDGINDFFEAELRGLTNVEVVVFDRWGRKVFSANRADFRWDGTDNGNPMPIGVYVYLISATRIDTGQDWKLTGSVSLVR
jgi:gliding motility-associated-like protein